MSLVRTLAAFAIFTCTAALAAQLTGAPILTTPPQIQYPPIARAAHVSGKVIVDFSIESDGRTFAVKAISGPEMLRGAVVNPISQWRFSTPLPVTAAHDFEAVYEFKLHSEDENLEDDLDAPPSFPCCGDVIMIRASDTVITGTVESLDGAQSIDVTPSSTPPPAPDRCPEDKQRQPPSETKPNDFIELERALWEASPAAYRVRVSRSGLVEWHGLKNVAGIGDRVEQIPASAAESLLERFTTPGFWSACAVEPPTPSDPPDPDDPISGDYLTVQIDGHFKVVNFTQFSFPDETTGPKLAWAVDKAADTHHWRHGDPALESFLNAREDIQLPKPGMTRLIRATFRFNSSNAQLTVEPLKHFIAAGDDVDAPDASGWTPLMYAEALDSYDEHAADLLLAANAHVNQHSLHGDTALMAAAYSGQLSQKLLDAGAEINAANADGVTTLMLLSQFPDNINTPDELTRALAAGADPKAQDRSGRTALDYLRSASCGKPNIPLPAPYMVIPSDQPSPCPSTSDAFKHSERILTEAMKKSARR